MEGRVALSASAIHSKVMHVAASEQGPTELERRFLDGLNSYLAPDLTFSPRAREAMTRVPFSFRKDVDAYKAKLRANKVAFTESGSIVVMKAATTADFLSEVEPFADALKRFRRGNRAYASHFAAGVVIAPPSGTIRVLTFLPSKPAKPAMPVGRAAAGS
jgi:hypothetical protein